MKHGYGHMRCALIGEHLGHSFSAQIHASIADYTYDMVELRPEAVEAFVKNGGYDAFNVTIPYKQAVLPFLDSVSPEAERIGSVNTVVRRPDGTLHGYNTDYFGFDEMLTLSGIDVRGAKVLVFGNGGASLTVQAVLRDRGAREILIFSRKGPNTYDTLPLHTDAEVIVNATPVGMYPQNGESLVDLSLFPHCRGVLDVIYNPARTALLLDAERRGIPHINGLYMLVAQAVKAFEYFTGDKAEDGIIKEITATIAAETQNIILVGMPGCGKSTVGKALASSMGRAFYDTDEKFIAMHGVTPSDAIQTLGEERFRELEYQTLCELGKKSGTVIACGGGAVTRAYNYDPLHQNGIIVYLKRELSMLATDGRPLSARHSVEKLYAARKEAYERFADLTVESTEVVERTAEAMRTALVGYAAKI